MRGVYSVCLLAMCIALFGGSSVQADTQKPRFLLNCRLMDRVDPLYRRYCLGEPGAKIQLDCANVVDCKKKLLPVVSLIGTKSGDNPSIAPPAISPGRGGGTPPEGPPTATGSVNAAPALK